MPVNNLYYNKYIKYKNKYLNLQSQIGGVRYTGVDNVRKPLIAPINARSLRPLPAPSDSVPLIERKNSTFISCQGNQGTCWAHATTRLIMKLITNFFTTYFPSSSNNCHYYYDTVKCSNDITNIFDCFLRIKNGFKNCETILEGDKIIRDWLDENFYALLFHFIFLTLVKQFGRKKGVYSTGVTCLYILDYLKYIDITEKLIKERLPYIEKTFYKDSEKLYFNGLITKSVELFSYVKESLNNKIFNPIFYSANGFNHNVSAVYSISKYQYYTKEYELNSDYKFLPTEEISFKEKLLNKKIPFSIKMSNLNPVYTNKYNLRNLTGKRDLPTNIKYVLERNYYALFDTNGHAITITGCSGSVDNLFLHIKNSWGINRCYKEQVESWCNLIDENNKISMNLLLKWDKYFSIIFFYPTDYTYLTTITLQTLTINENEENNGETIALANALIQNKTLTSITLNNSISNEIGIVLADALANALIQNKTLTTLNINSHNIGNKGAIALADALKKNKTLTELSIIFDNINNEGAIAIGNALKENETLTTLNISSNNIGIDGAIALMQNKTIKKLVLVKNNITYDETGKVLQDLLIKNITLTELIINFNNFGIDGAKAIGNVLKQNSKLTTLYIGANNIGNEGAIALAEAFKINRTLTSTILNQNNISNDGAIAIASALEKNQTLTKINISSNNIGDDGAMAIANALKQNTTLTSFNISDNKITNQTKQNIEDSEVASRIILN